jgi:putative tryptophan/tyrosine transport system substrate-binding protein
LNYVTASKRVVHAARATALAAMAFGLLTCAYGAFAETRISVVYPDSAAALRKLYQTIADGIARSSDVRLQSRAVSDRDSADDVKAWVQANQSQIAIVLGDVPPTLTRPLAATMPLIRGADALDNGQPGVSLASSPAQLFGRLRQIKPDIERVFVVYKPVATGWLIAAARTAAREQGLELVASPSEDIQQSGATFSRILQQVRPDKDAIWLTLDPVVPVNQLLPVLLRESWEKHLVLFSNNPVDVAKGALFALYPDYPTMGRQLAERAKRQLARPSLSGPEASEHLNGAINVRTASHLGITLSDQQRQAFDRIFPETPE